MMKLPRCSDLLSTCFSKRSRTMLHQDDTSSQTTGGLTVFFTVLCIVDLFGVFPIIALPKNIIACGVYAFPLVASVFTLQLYTAVLLGRCWLLAQEIAPSIMEKNRFPYAAVAELAFGSHTRKFTTFLIDATVFSAGVPNFIVAAQSLQLFWWKITNGEVGVSYCHWMMVIGVLLCPVMWLGSPKDMKPLAVLSVVIVTTVAVCTWCCILLDDVSPPNTTSMIYAPSARDFLSAYGVIAFQFDIHPLLLTIQVDMKDSRKINKAVMTGFGITAVMFGITSFLAAWRYGNDVQNNILQGIVPSPPLFIVALLVTVQLCLSSAVGNSALFQHIEDFLRIPRVFCIQRCLVRSGIVAFAVFLGESVPSFDLVMGLVGSTLTGPLMFILPPLIFLKLCYMKSGLDPPPFLTKDYIIHLTKLRQNGFSNGKQNGLNNGALNGDSFQLIHKDALDINYKTFANESHNNCTEQANKYDVKYYDVIMALFVAFLGVAATAVATYSSWSDMVNLADFSPPCLVNASAAARDFIFNIKS